MIPSIGLVTEDRVYIGTGSAVFTLASAAYKDSNMFNFKIEKSKNTICSSCFFEEDLKKNIALRYFEDIVKDSDFVDGVVFDKNYIVNKSLNYLHKAFIKASLVGKRQEFTSFGGTLLLAKGKDLYILNDGFGVNKVDRCKSIGTIPDFCEEVIKYIGYDNDPIYLILKAIMMTENISPFAYPIIVRDTLHPSRTLSYSKEKAIDYIKKYESKMKGDKK